VRRLLLLVVLITSLYGCRWIVEEFFSNLGWVYLMDASLSDSANSELSKLGALLGACLDDGVISGAKSPCRAEIEDENFRALLAATAMFGYNSVAWKKQDAGNPDKKYFASKAHLLNISSSFAAGNMELLDIVKRRQDYHTKRVFAPWTTAEMAAQPMSGCFNGMTSSRQYLQELEFEVDSPNGTAILKSTRVIDKIEYLGVNSARVTATESFSFTDRQGNVLATGQSVFVYTIVFGAKAAIHMHSENTTISNSLGQQQQTIVMYQPGLITPFYLNLDHSGFTQKTVVKVYVGPPTRPGQDVAMEHYDLANDISYHGHGRVTDADGRVMATCRTTETRILTNTMGQQDESSISTVYMGNNNPLGGLVIRKMTTNMLGQETFRILHGGLFTRQSEPKKELLVFITPKIIQDN
jgi:hypothetical protein